jgi:hypothetical protein
MSLCDEIEQRSSLRQKVGIGFNATESRTWLCQSTFYSAAIAVLKRKGRCEAGLPKRNRCTAGSPNRLSGGLET